MTDKPDWEKAWEREYPGDASAWAGYPEQLSESGQFRIQRERWRYERGYLAASAHHETAIRLAKREAIAEVIRGAFSGSPTAKELFAKYSEPTAVAATEKEG